MSEEQIGSRVILEARLQVIEEQAEREKEAYAQAIHNHHAAERELEAESERLKAENARLRKALRDVAPWIGMCWCNEDWLADPPVPFQHESACENARAALTSGEEEQGGRSEANQD